MKKHRHANIPAELEGLLNFQPPKYFETYIKLASQRSVFINEDFTKRMASELIGLLLHYDNESADDITIYINSDGGDAHALLAIIDTFDLISAPVTTVCLGRAYSAGAYLLAAGTKGKRFALKHSEVMLHGVQAVFPVPSAESSSDAKSYYEFLASLDNGLMKLFAKQTGKTLEHIKQDCSRDLYLSAKDAVEYGVIDKVLG